MSLYQRFRDYFRPGQVEARGAAPTDGPIVPSDASLDEIIAAHRAFGSGGYSFGASSEGILFSWPSLTRCITLMASVLADLMTEPGSLIVLDADGYIVDNPRVRALREWLAYHPAGDEVAAHTWWEDFVTDLMTGNALCYRPVPGRRKLTRLRVPGADVQPGSDGITPVYYVERADTYQGGIMTLPRRRVIHARWGQPSGTDFKRQYFATAPYRALRQSSAIGQQLDEYVMRRFGPTGWKEGALLSSEVEGNTGSDSAAERQRFLKMGVLWASKRAPFVWSNKVDGQVLEPSMTEMATREQQEWAMLEAGRIFGIPGPFLGAQVAAWGSAMAQVREMFWKTGVSPFAHRLLAPFSARLLKPGEQFSIDPVEFLRGDLTAMSSILGNVVQAESQSGERITERSENRRLLGFRDKKNGVEVEPVNPGLSPPLPDVI